MNVRPAVIALLAGVIATPVAAQQPVQLSFFSPAQIVGEGSSVSGVRLNVLYTKNANVQYVDLGIGFNYSTGSGQGIQWAFVSITEGNFSGWQSGLASITNKTFTGLQTGAYTHASTGQGLQFGWVNTANSWHGLQLGLVNFVDHMNQGGLQIGVLNFIKTGGVAPVLPIVNFTF
ncbi:MAG: hypothetical protein HY275_10205 [Gemmatimonadetes bacterium]|nr:hypothetical protein [Gemmatimonadota bacterium]